ncbi:MAG: signal peptidase I, partial [Armatimonadota bacterium]
VDGESMAPALHQGDQLLVEKVTPRLGVVQRGDIILLRQPASNELLMKRVVATGGEDVRASGGRVYIDGEPLDEREYTKMPGTYFFAEQTVGQSEVFVLGDNRLRSDDSATWGPVSIGQVVGRCVTGPLPFHRGDGRKERRYAQADTASPASARGLIRAAARGRAAHASP